MNEKIISEYCYIKYNLTLVDKIEECIQPYLSKNKKIVNKDINKVIDNINDMLVEILYITPHHIDTKAFLDMLYVCIKCIIKDKYKKQDNKKIRDKKLSYINELEQEIVDKEQDYINEDYITDIRGIL